MAIPQREELYNPGLQAMKRLGGSASITEWNKAVIEPLLKEGIITENELDQAHNNYQTEVEYQLAWTRSYLKKSGYFNNAVHGTWILTEKGRDAEIVTIEEVRAIIKNSPKPKKLSSVKANNESNFASIQLNEEQTNFSDDPENEETTLSTEAAEVALERNWREELWNTVIDLSPASFEHLAKRLLLESGFVQVEVTGRSGDGGIDGHGIVQVGGLISFPIAFQCKRYQGSVASNAVRDFRGAMAGNADRGLIITTGTFTRDARQEASRIKNQSIDLIDGEKLLDKLKELRLGVKVEMIEKVTVDYEVFKSL